ncbi:complement factor H isoform X2 [Megalobrama amblycephala]|uniref:complement factor H isoform X2 n=1 Tax=Megalobrama amblycephala TaxID=75352 RepID=UPI002013D80D|nr:complement factor H isoform X2 [Megalobrama amblycephala]
MRVPVKLLGFVFWLFFFNCGQCEDCFRKDIKYENTEPAVKASYSNGETVRVNCMTGFTGVYRLKCEEGTWKATIERKCAKKKCSHPGDTPNGDFKLTAGSEFVFGATVLYTCKKGFEMTSRINQRTCRAQGWDNTVPVCEEITCTAPVISNGSVVEPVQEYQRDAILKYRCSPGFKPREGIPRCAKFGWTLNPECDEVTCELKSIRFGVKKINPEGKTIFRGGESVEITCAERYWIFRTKETIRSFTCQNNGEWDHEPVCEVIRCEVPRDQYVYRPYSYFRGDMTLGAKISYYCFDGVDYEKAEATCTQDGWTPKPLCAEKMCAAPIIPNAEILGDQRQKYSKNSWIQYQCLPGFEPEQPKYITCNSRTEWTGILQCTAKQKLCPALSVKNGFIHTLSSNEEEIFYSCDTGYKPFRGNWWDSVTCSRGSWSEEPQCIREEECGAFPSVHHGKLKQTKQIFNDGDTTALECDPGFKPTQRFIKCVSGTWETPVCEVDVHCDSPPKVENAFITSKPKEFYGYGSSVTYACRSSFLINGKSTVFCRSGTWEETPTCKEVMCVANLTENMRSDVTDDEHLGPEISVRSGHTITLTCLGKGMKLKHNKITCLPEGQWNVPFPKCIREVMCVANLTENMRSDVTDDEHLGPEISVRSGRTITLTCLGKGMKLKHNKITCLPEGQWNVPFPKCIREVMCVANLTENMRSDEHLGPEVSVRPGDTITLSCVGRELQGQSKISCLSDGKWNPSFPKCVGEVLCPLNTAEEDLKMERFPDIDRPVKYGDKLTFSCNREGLTLKGEKEITCLPSGQWSSPFPKCEAETTDDQQDKQ